MSTECNRYIKEKNRLYRELLGQTGFVPPPIKDTGRYAHNVVDLIHNKLKAVGIEKPPVLLSKIAEDLSVNPRLILNYEMKHLGKIEYDQAQDCFVIHASPRLIDSPTPAPNLLETDLNLRGRFTYAHEIAHRFFFIPSSNEGYQACRSLVPERDPLINMQEEHYCNYIARRSLLPEFLVADWLQEQGYDVNDPYPEIGNLISQLSQDFLVPYPSAIFTFSDAIRRGDVPQHPNLFAVYLAAFMRGTQVRAIRFESSFGPFQGNQLEIKPPFLQHIWEQDIYSSGLLGPDFRNFEREVFIKETEETQPINDLFIFIQNRVACLSGWAQPVFTDPEYRSVLIWGRLT